MDVEALKKQVPYKLRVDTFSYDHVRPNLGLVCHLRLCLIVNIILKYQNFSKKKMLGYKIVHWDLAFPIDEFM